MPFSKDELVAALDQLKMLIDEPAKACDRLYRIRDWSDTSNDQDVPGFTWTHSTATANRCHYRGHEVVEYDILERRRWEPFDVET